MWERLGTQFPYLFWCGNAVPTLHSLHLWELRSHWVPTLVVFIFKKNCSYHVRTLGEIVQLFANKSTVTIKIHLVKTFPNALVTWYLVLLTELTLISDLYFHSILMSLFLLCSVLCVPVRSRCRRENNLNRYFIISRYFMK